MKLTITFVLLVSTLSFGQTIPVDKKFHLGAGIMIGGQAAMGRCVKHPFWNAVLFSSVAGAGKEILDTRYGDPNVNDFLYTVGGGVISGGATYLIKRAVAKRRNKKAQSLGPLVN